MENILKNRTLAALAAALVIGGANPDLNAGAIPEPLPPPQELLEDAPYYPPQTTGGAFSPAPALPPQANYSPAPNFQPPPVYQPPLNQQPVFNAPNLAAPPMASFPPQPRPQAQPSLRSDNAAMPGRGGFSISPPMASMPDDYFNLPLLDEGIPGVLMPELDENFYDPGLASSVPGQVIVSGPGKSMPIARRPQAGLNQRQLDPFFDYAKNYEKEALSAKKVNNEAAYQDNLKKSVDAYMEIIAMADAGSEAREEAWYGVARCEYRRENWWKAFDALERSFPKDFDKNEVDSRIKLEMFIGERLWRLGYSPVAGADKDGNQQNGYQAAARVYAAAIFNQPVAKDAPLALLRRGDAAAMDGDWKEAAKFYRSVVQYYPDSEPAMLARSSLAEAVYRQDWPAGLPEAARTDLSNIMQEVEKPEQQLSPAAEERRQRAVTLANDLEAAQKLSQAKEYMKSIRVKKSRDAAVFLLGDIVSHYPTTLQAQEASMMLAEMGIQPPMVLSDGSHYPLAGNWYGEDPLKIPGVNAGGTVQLAGQSDRTDNSAARRGNGNNPANAARRGVPASANVPGTRNIPGSSSNPGPTTAAGTANKPGPVNTPPAAANRPKQNFSPAPPYPPLPAEVERALEGQIQANSQSSPPVYQPRPGSGYAPSLAPLDLHVPGVSNDY